MDSGRRGKLLCCLFATSWKPASMEQPFASEATIFTPCRSSWLSSQSHVQQQRLDSSVLWALPSPISCTPHSSSGFAILFSAASCTKLCCDCAVGLDMAKRYSEAPSLPTKRLCRALCTLYPFHLLYLILKSVYCKEAGCKIDTILNCTVI